MPREKTGQHLGGRESELTAGGVLLRLLFAATVVLLTYNPSGLSFFHWARDAFVGSAFGPLHLLAGIALFGAWAVLVTATSRSLGLFGVAIVAGFFAALVWLLIEKQVVRADTPSVFMWIALLGIALVLAVGMSWSHLRRRLTGQADVDEVDTR